jgi:hypothetical protein
LTIINRLTNLSMSIRFNNGISTLTPSFEQTKKWRSDQPWYHTGKSNECEIYQRSTIETITNHTCHKTNTRLHLSNKLMVEKTRPMKEEDGYEYSEDFDGSITSNDTKWLFNLKMICDNGGAQTRSLREVYHFIATQLDHLLLFPKNNIRFINILDGDTSFKNINKFNYLLNKSQYEFIKHNVFVGDMCEFEHFWEKNNT